MLFLIGCWGRVCSVECSRGPEELGRFPKLQPSPQQLAPLSKPFSILGQGSCHYVVHTDHRLSRGRQFSCKHKNLSSILQNTKEKKLCVRAYAHTRTVSCTYNPNTEELDTGELLIRGSLSQNK